MNETTQLEKLVPVEAADAPGVTASPHTELTELTTLLTQMQENSARQCEYQRKQLRLTRLFAGVCAAALAVVVCVCLMLAPRVNTMLTTMDDVMVQAQAVAVNLEHVSNQLVETDIAAMLQNVDGLVTQSQTGITQALGSVQTALAMIESLDIESLNASIQDLHSIISPLATLLGK